MALAHCLLDTKGNKYTHSGCVIIVASAQQQWLHERPLILLLHTLPVLFTLLSDSRLPRQYSAAYEVICLIIKVHFSVPFTKFYFALTSEGLHNMAGVQN